MKFSEDAKAALIGVAIIAYVTISLTCFGCRLPPPGTTGRKVIDCSAEAIQQQWPGAIGPVNTCLTGGGSYACLLGLIRPAAGITEDLIACLVRNQGSEFAAAAAINFDDVRSARAAESARAFLGKRHYEIANP